MDGFRRHLAAVAVEESSSTAVERQLEAWGHAADGLDRALACVERGDSDYGLIFAMLRSARSMAKRPFVWAVDTAVSADSVSDRSDPSV